MLRLIIYESLVYLYYFAHSPNKAVIYRTGILPFSNQSDIWKPVLFTPYTLGVFAMKIGNQEHRLTPLQETVVRLTNQFDTDEEVQYEILFHGLPPTIWLRLQTQKRQSRFLLKLLGSSVWLREATRGYLLYLEYLLGKIRGEEATPLLLPDNFSTILKIENLRSQWIQSETLREAVEELQAVLNQVFTWFNIQLICELVQAAFAYTAHQTARPSFCQEVTSQEAQQEWPALANLAYTQGRAIFSNRCHSAQEQLKVVGDVDSEIIQLFIFTPIQLHLLAAVHRGSTAISAADITDRDEHPQPAPAWKATPSGLIVPGSL